MLPAPFLFFGMVRMMGAIADPNIALTLLVVGLLGVYVEFCAPGLIAPGVIGGILVLFAASAFSALPLNWVGVGLLLVSFALLAPEGKWRARGILGATGAVAMAVGAVMLVDSPAPELGI